MNKKQILKLLGGVLLILSTAVGVAQAQDKSVDAKKIEQMNKRISELESQILNMQVMIGTLESLVKQNRNAAPSGVSGQPGGFDQNAGGSGSSDRIDFLESQVRALAAQVQQLAGGAQNGNQPVSGSGDNGGGFGNTEVARSNSERRIESRQLNSPPPSGEDEGESLMMYEQAKSHLLRRDYESAETAFQSFLDKYKQDALAGEAQYWLGESYLKQKKYKAAADSFLKGYSKYRSSKKAPNSLFKLALTLNLLGQKDAACRTFTELRNTYPQMDEILMQMVSREERRIKC